ncbi:hypothetical protein GCM10011380_17640 [Sphingomonas metalli]|uniref:Pili assembly chaperone N-terminal domain-containing protein n=1 Tax=Sphingomonas metalli TaxID=1779358 RepID=A0A916WSG9_9SPHN|nr:fimbria/pilus periplasmic chaperone [Sphingomonas metalli]GGB28487.1 hypothetical protein GCM10011380_17640 [Sphingomonas metalli]
MQRLTALFLSLAGLFAPAMANAAAVVIWPVDPVLRPGETATAIWLENKGDAPVTLQVRTFGWSQPAGEDRLDAQDRLVASPPIATVAPGARQLVRLIRRAPAGPAAPPVESAYRLIVDELPPPPAPAVDGAVQARLQVQMRYSIPLFAYAAAPAAPALGAQVTTGPAGRMLTIHNDGTTHARLTDLRLIGTGGRETMLRAGLVGYVLAGATIVIPLGDHQGGVVRVGVNGTDTVLGGQA